MTKRLFDIVFSLLGILILLPIFVSIAFFTYINLGSPIFFRQIRPGKNGKPFQIIKFRTMTDWKNRDGVYLSDQVRMTPFGHFLRSSSLDELPELWNVLKGDMSIVGPRPLLLEYLPLYSKKQQRRHDLRPGIIGWAQINGRNEISWKKKFELDLWYIENRNFLLDLKIILITLKKTVLSEGISREGEATVPKFKGEKK